MCDFAGEVIVSGIPYCISIGGKLQQLLQSIVPAVVSHSQPLHHECSVYVYVSVYVSIQSSQSENQNLISNNKMNAASCFIILALLMNLCPAPLILPQW